MTPKTNPAAEPTVDDLRPPGGGDNQANLTALRQAAGMPAQQPVPGTMDPDRFGRTHLRRGHARENGVSAGQPGAPFQRTDLKPGDFDRAYLTDEGHSRQSPGNTRTADRPGQPHEAAPFVGSYSPPNKVDTGALWVRLEAARRA